MPGLRRPARTAGVPIADVYPVLPLADGVGVAIGAISWGDSISFGITIDSGLVPAGEELAGHVLGAFDDLQELGDGQEEAIGE
jgi:diacylglycerol O-acyltransferase / wax synthase